MTKTKVAGAKNKFGLSSIILFIGALYCSLPVAWVVIASTKSPRELFSTFSFAPGTGLWDNLMSRRTYGGGQYWQWVLNSAQYAGVGALISALASAMAGYGLAKFAFRGRDFIFGMILAGVLVPGIVLAIPQYLLLAKIGLAGSYWSVLLPVIINPFGIFLAKGAGDSDMYPQIIIGSALSILPLMGLLLFIQRYWRADLLAGGLKG